MLKGYHNGICAIFYQMALNGVKSVSVENMGEILEIVGLSIKLHFGSEIRSFLSYLHF